MWIVAACAASVVYFKDTLVKFQPQYHPSVWGFNGTKVGWINSRVSLIFDSQDNVVAMRKCSKDQYLSIAEQHEIILIHIIWCFMIFLTHAGMLMWSMGY